MLKDFFHSLLAGQPGRHSRRAGPLGVQGGQCREWRCRERQLGRLGRGFKGERGKGKLEAKASLTMRAFWHSCIRPSAHLFHFPARQVLLQWCMA